VPRLYRNGQVLRTEDQPEGTLVVARVPEAELPTLAEFMAPVPAGGEAARSEEGT